MASASRSSAPAPLQRQSSLQREASVARELHGNLLYLAIASKHPELAGKLTGMLLELGAADIADILRSDECREEAVTAALKVLRDAGDERAAHALSAPAPPAPRALPPKGRLEIDVAAAHAVAAAEGVAISTSTGLTPALAATALMRMSPRVSSNPYASARILSRAAMAMA